MHLALREARQEVMAKAAFSTARRTSAFVAEHTSNSTLLGFVPPTATNSRS